MSSVSQICISIPRIYRRVAHLVLPGSQTPSFDSFSASPNSNSARPNDKLNPPNLSFLQIPSPQGVYTLLSTQECPKSISDLTPTLNPSRHSKVSGLSRSRWIHGSPKLKVSLWLNTTEVLSLGRRVELHQVQQKQIHRFLLLPVLCMDHRSFTLSPAPFTFLVSGSWSGETVVCCLFEQMGFQLRGKRY